MALPGVKTTILNRFYNQARTDLPSAPTIAVIAKRNNATTSTVAPDITPYLAVSESDVITQFGENSYLHRAYYEVTTAGAGRCILIPLPANTVFNHGSAAITSSSYPTLTLFDEVFAACEAARVDIIVPWGKGSDTYDWDDYATPVATPGGNATDFFYADNSISASVSWAKKIADKCADITTNSYPVLAVMGLKGVQGQQTPLSSDVTTGFTYPNLISRENVTNGHFISIVAAEFEPINMPQTWGWSNGACTYAALITRLPSYSATTGKPVYNVDQMRYNPTRPQAEALGNKGLVCVQLDFQNSPRWVDGTTFAPATSDYVRLSTLRIMFDVVKIVRSVSQAYIGEGMSLQNRNAFETQISSSLASMQKVGAINNADFRVQYAPSVNKAFVDLAIVPAFELREVYLQVAVNF